MYKFRDKEKTLALSLKATYMITKNTSGAGENLKKMFKIKDKSVFNANKCWHDHTLCMKKKENRNKKKNFCYQKKKKNFYLFKL